MNKRLNYSLWELYNEYSIKEVMFKREAERISIQNDVPLESSEVKE